MDPAFVEVIHGRNNLGIDPHLHIWGWEVPVYLFLGGVVAGIMVAVALLELVAPNRKRSLITQVAPAVGVVLMSLGMGALFLDLAYKFHVYRFYMSFQPTSPMSWGSWLLLLVYPALILASAGSLTPELREKVSEFWAPAKGILGKVFEFADRFRQQIIWSMLGLGIGLGVYTGLLLGTMVSRIQWNSAALGPLFLVSGVSTGIAFMMLFDLTKEEAHRLVVWDTVAIAVEFFFLGVIGIGHLTGGRAGMAAAENFITAHWAPHLWGLVFILGLFIPMVMNLIEIRTKRSAVLATPLLILFGGFALRMIIVYAGQENSLMSVAGW